jgi:primosomal protein N' (replication factor Y)
VLVLVPEINLTPQLLARFAERFGHASIACLHSGLTPAQRLQAWLAAHTGQARIVLGTRMAVLASMPQLALIVVDEEHDPSYKQQEGARYSARDLALCAASTAAPRSSWARPRLRWKAGMPAPRWPTAVPGATSFSPCAPRGRNRRAPACRACCARGHGPPAQGTLIAPPLLAAIGERVARGEQALVLLNRRGWAPVLHCADCGWKASARTAARIACSTRSTARCAATTAA